MIEEKFMKKTIVGLSLIATSLLAGSALADAQALAQKKGCLNCHKIDTKLVGPAYKDVAAKFKDDPNAVTELAAKVKNGSVGVWGQIPMPPNNVTDAEAKELVEWVLSH
jgi:cytochrome c